MRGRDTPVSKSMHQQRIEGRKDTFNSAKVMHEELVRMCGLPFLGRDESGLLKPTRRPSDLGIFHDGWMVRINFKRENKEEFEGLKLGDVEKRLKASNVPRIPVGTETHIITGVRMLRHIREGYEKELSGIDLLLDVLEAQNSQMYQQGKPSDKQIDELLSSLHTIGKELAKKKTAIKRIVGIGRVDKTIDAFSAAKEIPIEKRAPQISRACAILTSLRNRLGKWREEQIAGIYEYNLERECALRVERDLWLLANLKRLAKIPETTYGHTILDFSKILILQKLRSMVARKMDRWETLELIKKTSDLFKPPKERSDHEENIILLKSGKKIIDTRDYSEALNLYRRLYRYIRDEDNKNARKTVKFLLNYFKASKPRFTYDELIKNPYDSYLDPVLEPLVNAVYAFEAQHFTEAAENFLIAAEELNLKINGEA